MGSAGPAGAGCVQGGCSPWMGSVPRWLLSPGRGAPHPLSLCSETLGPVRIQSAPLRKLDLRSPCEARFVPPRNFHCGYFWRPCRSVAAWVIQLLALLLAASGGSPRAWAPINSPPAWLFLLDECFGSLWAVFWSLLASQSCEGLMAGYRLEPQRRRNVVREGFVSPAPCPFPGQPGRSGALLATTAPCVLLGLLAI